jgi:hypothetical protein
MLATIRFKNFILLSRTYKSKDENILDSNYKSTQRHMPQDGILHSHRCENLKSYGLLSDPRREGMTFHSEELHSLHSPRNIIIACK